MEPFVEFWGTLSLPQLAEVYREIPFIAQKELNKWIKSDNSEEIDERYLYVSQKHLNSITLLTSHAVTHHSNYVALWLLRFFDPDRIVEDDFLDPTLFSFKPMAEAVRLTITMLQELITRSEALQQTYVNFQYIWTVYETSKLTTKITENILTQEEYKTGKEAIRKNYLIKFLYTKKWFKAIVICPLRA